VIHVPLGEALAMVDRKEIKDAKSIAGIALAVLHVRHQYPSHM